MLILGSLPRVADVMVQEAYRAELERQMAERKEREVADKERDRAEAAAIKVSLPSGVGLGRPSPPRMLGRPTGAPAQAFFPPQPPAPVMSGYGSANPPRYQGMPAGPAAGGAMAMPPGGAAAPPDDGEWVLSLIRSGTASCTTGRTCRGGAM